MNGSDQEPRKEGDSEVGEVVYCLWAGRGDVGGIWKAEWATGMGVSPVALCGGTQVRPGRRYEALLH